MQEYRLAQHRGKFVAYRRTEAGQPERRSLGTDDSDLAKKRFSEFLKQLEAQERDRGYTIEQLWERRREALAGRRANVSMSFTGLPILRVFGSLTPSGITEQRCKDYIEERRSANRKDGTILTELNHLRSTLTWAVKQGLIESAPAILRPHRPPPKTDYLTKDQFRAFLQCCSAHHIRLFAILAVSTGARASALLELTWDRVDLEKRRIDLRTEDMANKKGRATVPINDTALEALTKAKEKRHTDYVIEYAASRVRSVKKGIKAAATKASLPFVSPHVFRHSAAVWMAEGGVSMEEIAQYLGHSNTEITRRVYARFSPDYLGKAAKALEL